MAAPHLVSDRLRRRDGSQAGAGSVHAGHYLGEQQGWKRTKEMTAVRAT